MIRSPLALAGGLAGAVLMTGCAGAPPPQPPAVPAPTAVAPTPVTVQQDRTEGPRREPVLPPQLAMLAGLMPLRSIGADTFRVAHPTYDGRGVLIAILDSGIDAGVPGLRRTSTGEGKILDLRDFSGEGQVALSPIRAESDGSVTIGGQRLVGFGRVARLAAPPYYGGVVREITLGAEPEGDLNGNGVITDAFPLVVAKGTGGWVVFADTDADGSLDGEAPISDFAVSGATFTLGRPPTGSPGPITIAATFEEAGDRPLLTLVLDNSSHGTHVAGIAAGHDLFGVNGFDGVAPGAWLLGLKISNNARGGVSVTGSMLRALNYAADFAEERGLPLVINLSFGVGNEIEGAASIDSLVNEFALKHPDVLVVISAGNDGPGLSTVGFPGSADLALSVCALFPGAFTRPPEPAPDLLGWWSGRGGEVAKPDVCAPGVAFSNVPRWRTGEEISSGTSMAAPHASGAAALLLSAMQQQGRQVRAVDLKRALMATATPVPGATVLDAGSGVIDVTGAYRWLLAAHQTGIYEVHALDTGEKAGTGSAAFRRAGLRFPGDTLQQFAIRSVGGQPAARLLLEADAPWLAAPPAVDLQGRPETVTVRYDAFRIREPGLYVGTVWARPATDTIAGPSFGLVNSVVVPRSLDRPYATSGALAAGEMARFFFDVPQTRGGVLVQLLVSEPHDEATLYLFEPSGQPFRGRSSVTANRASGRAVALEVTSDDLQPGVYEAVVVAPPNAGVRYGLEASLPVAVVTAIDSGPRAVVTNATSDSLAVRVSSWLLGAVKTSHVNGMGSAPVSLPISPPEWAARLVVDVSLPQPLWNLLTDFGVTLFDADGRKVNDAPLNYAFGRHQMNLDSSKVSGPLTLELLPGFAHFEPPENWEAEVRIAFELPEPMVLVSPATTGLEAWTTLPPAGLRVVPLPPLPDDIPVPLGFQGLVEVRAIPPAGGAGPEGARRGGVAMPQPTHASPENP